MVLCCSFANGSLTRENVRNREAKKSWDEFESLLDSTPRGNFGNLGSFFKGLNSFHQNVFICVFNSFQILKSG